ncbi:hypothetical protein BH10CYA1_BH10CYA1_42310 [soil metagenome]
MLLQRNKTPDAVPLKWHCCLSTDAAPKTTDLTIPLQLPPRKTSVIVEAN